VRVLRARRVSGVFSLLLLIECFDEVVFAVLGAAWPLIRDDLSLSYAQIGLLMAAPSVASAVLEPPLALAGDTRWRSRIIVAGGIAFALALLLTMQAQGFVGLLLAFLLMYPASGGFVSLSQAVLVDLEPDRAEQAMARWSLAGSTGIVVGPLLLGGGSLLGMDWRGTSGLLAVVALVLAGAGIRLLPRATRRPHATEGRASLLEAIRRRETLRWLALLGLSDLMLDVLFGLLALYVVDAAGGSAGAAGLAVMIWIGAGLIGDALLIPALERFRGLDYLRVSAAVTAVLYAAFLLVPSLPAKFALLAALGLANAGWYSILQAQLYRSLPGQSGMALAVSSVSGSVTGLLPLALGLLASAVSLEAAMWLLLAGPIGLLAGIPRNTGTPE
jgi:MFS transporter, FSR family, fosmidomycin resistance protein